MYKLLQYIFIGLFVAILLPQANSQQRGDLIEFKELQDYSVADIETRISELSGLSPILSTLTLPLINVQYPQKMYKIAYHSIDIQGNLTKATGLVLIPEGYACELSTVIYSHGTTFNRRDVPSYENMAEVVFGFGYAGAGYFMLMPDYIGMGSSPGLHPYVEEETMASSNLDMIRAARIMAAQLSVPLRNEIFITGYSEGGGAAMATAKAVKEQGLTAEFGIGAVGAGAGPYDLSELQFDYIANDPFYPTSQYILYVASMCGELGIYIDNNNPAAFLLPPYDQYYTEHILGQTGVLGWVPDDWTTMFDPAIIDQMKQPNSEMRQCLELSNTYDWFNEYDTNLYYCDTDEQVDPQNAFKAESTQRGYFPWWDIPNQLDIFAAWMGPFSHSDCAIPTFLDARNFFNARRSGCPSPLTQNGTASLSTAINIPAYSYYNTEIEFSEVNHTFVKVEAYDMTQTLVETKTVYSTDKNIVLEKLVENPGVYALKFTTAAGQEIWKTATAAAFEVAATGDHHLIQKNAVINTMEANLEGFDMDFENIRILTKGGKIVRDYKATNLSIKKADFSIDKGDLPSGEYVLEIKTALKSYFLELNL